LRTKTAFKLKYTIGEELEEIKRTNTVEGLGDQRETTSSSTPLFSQRIQTPFECPQSP